MDKFFLKFVPHIAVALVIALHTICYILTMYCDKKYFITIWIYATLVDMLFLLLCGKLIHRLHNLSYTDALTKVYNRGFFYIKMKEELRKFKKETYKVSLLMIDMDNFKAINDTYGHVVGDKLVSQLARILANNIREEDSIIRWGGDEFAIILPETDTKEAYIIAERIRQIIESQKFFSNTIEINITISIGIACINEVLNVDTFVDLADCALYKAKRIKNTVVNLE